jgi:predicted short-subunit dehydrogenase-like oxidoreductase (DUF2520 family)
MGQGLALALQRRGYAPVLIARRVHQVAPTLLLHAGDPADAVRPAEFVLIATPDDSVPDVVEMLAQSGAIKRDQAVLHLSGLLDSSALSALAGTGAALGSFHPLQTIADPATAAERLAGSFVGLEGDDRAIEAGERLAKTLRMTPVRVTSASKPAYHAAATIVANYTVVLVGIAERLAREAGVPPEQAHKIYLPLLDGALQNLKTMTPGQALTGPVRRGDVRTIEAHLEALEAADRKVYRELGLAALELAKTAGLDEKAVKNVVKALKSGER